MFKDFTSEIMSYPGGEKITACIQCGTCSGSCPTSHAMEYTPRKLITLIRANQRETVLNSLDIWKCASCYSCTARCPRGIKFTDIMYILKTLTWKEEKKKKNQDITAFYSAFQNLITSRGRMNEAELVIRYSFKTSPAKLIAFAPLGLNMLIKGRASFIPPSIKNKNQVLELLQLAQERGDT